MEEVCKLAELLDNCEYIYKHASPETINSCDAFLSAVKNLVRLEVIKIGSAGAYEPHSLYDQKHH